MRRALALDVDLVLDADGDPRAPGAAVTLALCGSWDHSGPCPLAPHHTGVTSREESVALRVLFAPTPPMADLVRERIIDALAGGSLTGPDGRTTTWVLASARTSDLTVEEAEHAARLEALP